MKLHPPTQRTVLIAAMALVVIAAAAVRFLPSQSSAPNASPDGQIVASTTVPLFTSAAFFDGDVLHGVGPEWTFLSQTNFAAEKVQPYNPFEGTVPIQVATIKLAGKTTELALTEFSIKDRTALDASMKFPGVQKAQVAGRDGYFVPSVDESGSSGFAIIGTNSVLFIQYGDSAHAGFAQFPTTLEPEVQSFVASIQVQ